MRGEERDAEYFQHVYMALGRAQTLDWLLLQNFSTPDPYEHAHPVQQVDLQVYLLTDLLMDLLTDLQ